jgi:hypothetical protein
MPHSVESTSRMTLANFAGLLRGVAEAVGSTKVYDGRREDVLEL